MVLIFSYFFNKCQDYPVFKAVCCQMHGATQEFHQTLAQAATVAVAAQCHMALDASAFRDCHPLRVMLLPTILVGTSIFGGQFLSSNEEEVMRSQEQLNQVRRLASADSRAAQGSSFL